MQRYFKLVCSHRLSIMDARACAWALVINYLLVKAAKMNTDMRVFAMSATPVINSLHGDSAIGRF